MFLFLSIYYDCMKYVRVAIIKVSTDTTKEANALVGHFAERCNSEDQYKGNLLLC